VGGEEECRRLAGKPDDRKLLARDTGKLRRVWKELDRMSWTESDCLRVETSDWLCESANTSTATSEPRSPGGAVYRFLFFSRSSSNC